MSNNLSLALITVVLTLLTVMPFNSFAKDISKKVVNETSLDEYIILFCNEYCLGNQRKGYLKSLTIDKKDSGNYRVTGKVALQSRHVIKKYVLYDHTVIINTFGTLKPDSCELRVDDVFIQNDFNNIFKTLLKNHSDVIGRKEKIDNCQRFFN